MWFAQISRVLLNQNSESLFKTAPLKGTKPNTLSNADILSVAIKTLRLFLMYQSRTLPLFFLPSLGNETVFTASGIFFIIIFLSIIAFFPSDILANLLGVAFYFLKAPLLFVSICFYKVFYQLKN